MADDEGRVVGLDEVEEAVRRSEERGGTGQDRLEQLVLAVPIEQGEGRLVERPQVGIGHRLIALVRASGRLGQVHRRSASADEGVLGPPVVGVAGDADADRDGRSAGLRRQLGDGTSDPIRHLVGGLPIGAGQDRRELVAAVAIEAVAFAGGAGEGPGDGRQQGVAGRVAAGVVERLERVHVEHQDREGTAADRDRLAELALERAVVAQTGQGVLLRPDPDRAVDLGVLEGDRGLAGEQLGQLELVRR